MEGKRGWELWKEGREQRGGGEREREKERFAWEVIKAG